MHVKTPLLIRRNGSLAARLALAALLLLLAFPSAAHAAQLKEARVSQVVRDVRLLPNQAAPRPARVSDEVRDGTAVRTGLESRAELTFTDATLARLGANTIFSFSGGTRNLELGGGAMLLRVPKDAGGAQINTAAITAAITGTTMLLEYHPDAYCKFIMLEGTARIFRNRQVGESVLLGPGQMLIVNPNGKGLPEPVDVDLDRLLKTSRLIGDFAPLASTDLIARETQTQGAKKNEGGLVETNLVIFGGGTAISMLDPTASAISDQANANQERQEILQPSPSPTPGATASPSVTPSPTVTPTPSTTPSPTSTPSPTTTPTPSASPTPTITPSPTISPTPTPSPTISPTPTPSPTISPTPTPTVSPTPTPSATPTPTITPPPATSATYNGGTGNWSNPASWTPGVVPDNGNNGDDYDVTFASGTLTQDIVAGVTINQLFMSGGTLVLANPLTLNFGLQFTGGAITSGTLNVAGDSVQSVVMTVANTTINNSGNYQLTLASGNVFSGSGSLFNNSGIVRRTIGTGSVTFNIPLVNSGMFLVESSTLTLFGANPVVNSGLLQASGGSTLLLSGGIFTNAGGTITALEDSFVQLTASASVIGGTLSTVGSGVIQANSGANTSIFLTDLTLDGALVGINDSDITLAGTITNLGSITSANTTSVTDLVIDADGVTLNGGGTVTLSTSNDGIRTASTGARLINVDNLIQGQGLAGQNDTAFTNQTAGVFDANVSSAVLTIDPASVTDAFINNGVLQASNGGILVLSGNGGGGFTNNNLITALDGSIVQLTASASIIGGTLSTVGSGVIQANSGANTSIFLTGLTIDGTLVGINDSDITLAGSIINSGSITTSTATSVTDLVIAAGGVTLSGGGTVTLSTSNDGIRANPSGSRLTNVDNLIQGQGLFGQNSAVFTNQAAGIIDANVGGASLILDPANLADAFVNDGLLRASNGGILVLSGNGGGEFINNTLITALEDSFVQLTASASVIGGTLSTVGSGVIQANSGANTSIFLTDLTLDGTLVGINDSDITLAGTITNLGSITSANTTSVTDLVIDADGVTLNGGGTVTLSTSNDGIRAASTGARLINVDNLIQGQGLAGQNNTAFTNQSAGVFDANVSGAVLTIDPASVTDAFINNGVLQASNGGILVLSGNGGGGFTNNNLITALDGSIVQLTASASIVGGTLSTVGSGVIQANSGANTSIFLTDLTIDGTLVGINDSDITLAGSIISSGSITTSTVASVTDLVIAAGGVILSGGGTVTLSTSNDGIRANPSGSRLTNVDNLIQGQGLFGQNSAVFTNQADGVISANAGATLTLDPAASALDAGPSFLNNGTLQASDGGTLLLSGNGGGGFTNNGTIESTGGALQFTGAVTSNGVVDVGADSLSITGAGSYTQNAGTFRVAGGTVTSSTALNFVGGLVDARGTITAALSNGGNLRPALGGAGLNVTGAVTLLASSQLTFQLGGLTQGTEYGFLNVNGTVALDGQLVLSFVDAFQAGNNDNFTVLSATSSSGAFDNVASGTRLATTDGSGTFLVTYEGTTVVLSDFEPNEEAPATPAATPPKTAAKRPTIAGRAPGARAKGRSVAVVVKNTDQLLDLLEETKPNAAGKVVARPRTASSGGGAPDDPPRSPAAGKISPRPPREAVPARSRAVF